MEWFVAIKFSDMAIIIATFSGPIMAIQVQKWLERRREIVSRRDQLFRILMTTRATTLAPIHVEALNSIAIDFSDKNVKSREVLTEWRRYNNHLNTSGAETDAWHTKRSELYINLLYSISGALGYSFTREELLNDIYSPRGHHKRENEEEIIRVGMADLLTGKRSVGMDVTNFPFDPEVRDQEIKIRKLLTDWLNKELKNDE